MAEKKQQTKEKDTVIAQNIYLSTGIQKLDLILDMDNTQITDNEVGGGFLIRRSQEGKDFETPIILINGETGAGKTTLLLQIAFSAARERSKWLPCFCSLEQSVQSLQDVAFSFDDFQEIGKKNAENAVKFYDLAKIQDKPINFKQKNPTVYLCHLAPRPISEGGNTKLFEIRLDQLNHIIEKIKANKQKSAIPVFFIDSINAFSSETLTRNEIYRLYSLFRNHHVPVILTVEHHMNYDLGVESDCVQNAKFLADVAISLTKDSSANYLLYYLEIEKSRVSRQALGKHIYKIRTSTIAEEIHHDPRTGIVLYPSIHSVLSKAREQKPKGQREEEYFVCEDDTDLQEIIKDPAIKPGECFSIIGPPGTHKLALGMNLAMGHSTNRSPSLLVVNFGGSGDFKFDGVAWTRSRQDCKNLKKIDDEENDIKFWNTKYECKTAKGSILVTVISFKIGQVTAEECFYVIDKVIDESKEKRHLSSVLLSDTAELCNGFPLLTADPLFLPALIDLFAARKLVTVCIGVDEGQHAKNTDINFSLSSRADYRIVLSHFPNIHDLSEKIVKRSYGIGDISDEVLTEQLVSLVVDNVTGKHYGREPRWLYVSSEDKGKSKTLHCEKDPPSPDDYR